jgi:O-antigen/teichoic acid export membrane protein
VLALGLCAAAPAIVWFYQAPILKPLTFVMALAIFLGALGAIHATLLSKRLDFRTHMKVSAGATLVSGITAVALAWRGYGVWALAAQTVAMAGVTTCLFWVFNPWRPTWTLSRASARKLFGFGGYHLASSMLEIIYSRIYTLLIGKLYGPRELGFYANADAVRQMPTGFLASVLVRVAFPMFSSAAHDKVKLRRGMQLSIRGMMLLNVPIALGVAAVAEPLVRVLLGLQWLPAVPILRVLCLAGALYPLHVINLQVLMAQGHSRLMFRLEVAKKLLGVALIGVGAIFGVIGVAWSQVVFSIVVLAINTYYTRRFLDYGIAAQLRDFLPILFVAAPMAAIVYVLGLYWQPAPLLWLATMGIAGAFLFFLVAWLVDLDALKDVVTLFRRRQIDSGASDATQ